MPERSEGNDRKDLGRIYLLLAGRDALPKRVLRDHCVQHDISNETLSLSKVTCIL